MKSWIMLGVSVLILSFAASADKAIHYTHWWLDGHYAIAQARDALEVCGIEDVDNAVTVIAPDKSRGFVAGHVRTKGGTLPFSVTFGGAGKNRVPVRVTVGSKTLLPSAPAD
jgi:hypothetical protein